MSHGSLENRLEIAVKRIQDAEKTATKELPDGCSLDSVRATFNVRYKDEPIFLMESIPENIRNKVSIKAGEIAPSVETKDDRPLLSDYEVKAILERTEKICQTEPLDFSLYLRPGDLLAICSDGGLLVDKISKITQSHYLADREALSVKPMINIRGKYVSDLPEDTTDPIKIIRKLLNEQPQPLSDQTLVDALYINSKYILEETGYSIDKKNTVKLDGVKKEDVCVILLDTKGEFEAMPLIYDPGVSLALNSGPDVISLGREVNLLQKLKGDTHYFSGKFEKNEFVIYRCDANGSHLSSPSGKTLGVFKVVEKQTR